MTDVASMTDGSGVVVWLTGPPASGKSTVAGALRRELLRRGVPCCFLDGDDVRARLHPSPGYDDEGRARLYATLADLGAMLAAQGLTVLVAATAHRRAYRAYARQVSRRFVEVHVRCERAVCAARDPKGLYARANAGELEGLPGAGVEYEDPEAPEIVVDTTEGAPDTHASRIAAYLLG